MKTLYNSFIALIGALFFTALIFLAIPVTNYIKLTVSKAPETEAYKVMSAAQKPPDKKTPPKPKMQKPPTKSQPDKSPKSIARQRFAMDLGVGGGSGGAQIASGSGMDQLSYSEGEADVAPVPLRTPAPAYPSKALSSGVGGRVRMRILINTSGDVEVNATEFIETPGDYGFEDAIREVLPKWKFKPATIDGIPVASKMEFPLEF
jgi:protein TonB